MEQMQTFVNEDFGSVRVVERNGEPWFVGKDVTEILKYQNGSRDVNRHVDEEDRHKVMIFDGNQNKETIIINESGLYSLILSSKMPEAKKFKRWVTSEILPTIRKTGGYVSNDELFIQTYLPNVGEEAQNLFRGMLENIRNMNRKIEEDKPKVLFADAVSASKTSILVGELAKLIKQNGVEIGQNRMFDWLRRNGYLIRRSGSDFNMPTQMAMEMGLFEIKETSITHADGHTSVSKTTKVTGKGQTFFINKFLSGKRTEGA